MQICVCMWDSETRRLYGNLVRKWAFLRGGSRYLCPTMITAENHTCRANFGWNFLELQMGCFPKALQTVPAFSFLLTVGLRGT